MPILAWRTQQTSNTTGTGTLVLNAAPAGRRSFQAGFGAGAIRVGYVISGASFFEVGYGGYDGGSPGTLTRATVTASSNAGALVSLPVGTVDVFPFLDPAQRGLVSGPGALALTLADVENYMVWHGSSANTITFPAIATVPPIVPWLVTNRGTAIVTIDPAGAELINGAATLALLPGESADCYAVYGGWEAVVTLRGTLKAGTGLADASVTLTGAQLVSGRFAITPAVALTLTIDTVANILAAIPGSVNDSHFEFTVVNLAAFDVTLAAGAGVGLFGRTVINNGSATWRVRRTSSTTLEVWRIEETADAGIGAGQIWQNVTGSRAAATTCTNSTGKPIM